MDEHQEPSFGRQVVRRAWFASWSFFADRRHDVGLGVLGVLLAAYQRFTIRGISTSLPDLGMDCVSVLAPFVVVWALLFVWHFWLGPAAIVYEVVKTAYQQPLRAAKAKQLPDEPINWTTWKHRSKFTAYELAAVLTMRDPISGGSSRNETALLRLITEQMNSGKLAYIAKAGRSHNYQADGSDEILRSRAIEWAKSKGYPVGHIE